MALVAAVTGGPSHGITRRGALAGAALFGLGVGLDQLLGSGASDEGSAAGAEDEVTEFFGSHQAGIDTPAQEVLQFAAFDFESTAVDDLREVLQEWTIAAAALTGGRPYGEVAGDAGEAPTDPGEAIGLGPMGLTLTFGLGPGLFDRLGLTSKRPAALTPLPAFQGESLDPDRSGGDLCVQACAEHPQVAFHAIHVLARIAARVATLRWQQAGFGRTSSTSRSQPTPRNLMGFKDGTNNVRTESSDEMDEFVWVQPDDDPAWMAGGSYLAMRRIKILLDVWDATSLEEQESTVGRTKVSGAPLGARDEYDPVNLEAKRDGALVVPSDAHIRLASPERNDDQRILRRGYSYSEPPEPGSGQIDAGLFFICFQRDPRRQFIPLQHRLARSDALNHHTVHTASAVFACPPGAPKAGGFIGEGLFA